MILDAVFGTAAMRAVFSDEAWLRAMLDTEAALARVQGALGIIPLSAAVAIDAAARALAPDAAKIEASTGRVGYPVVNLAAQIAEAAGPDAGAWTHWGATTQDILDTASVVQMRAALDLIEAELRAIVAALSALADKHRGDLMAGRTHLQHALPITFGFKCAVWLTPLATHLLRLRELRARVEIVSFGGAAGTLASLGGRGIVVADGLALALSLRAPPLPWHASRDTIAETGAFLALVCGSLAKIATDVVLLAQTEIAEAFEPSLPGRGGSSTMPQKQNPIASEYMLAAARMVHALVPVLFSAQAIDHERGTGPWQAEFAALPQCFILTAGALAHARALAEGLRVDPARMRANLAVSDGLILAEAVMMAAAPAMGRDAAHHAVHAACADVRAHGGTLADALRRDQALAPFAHVAEAPGAYLGSTDAFIGRALAHAAAVLAHPSPSPSRNGRGEEACCSPPLAGGAGGGVAADAGR